MALSVNVGDLVQVAYGNSELAEKSKDESPRLILAIKPHKQSEFGGFNWYVEFLYLETQTKGKLLVYEYSSGKTYPNIIPYSPPTSSKEP